MICARLSTGVVDDGSFFEVHKNFAENIVVGFARLAGRSIGIVGNQPASLAGVLDIDSSVKGARFVSFCDCFNIPLLVFEDVPGFLREPIRNGMRSSRMARSFCLHFLEATVPRVPLLHARPMVALMM